MRVGILGGAFDPIHAGHLGLAEAARNHFALDRLFFVPSFRSPFGNTEKCATPSRVRLEMVKAAIRDSSRFDLSDLEIKRKGTSYTIDTLREFRKRYPAPHELFFVIGSDWAGRLGEWKEIDAVLELCQLAAAKRPGSNFEPFAPAVQQFPMAPADISSTRIREMIRNGQDVTPWVPQAVLEVVKKHHLYQS